MSDVFWAAAIAGGVGLAGNAFTYLAARANRRLDLVRLEAENERFHEERREPERQNRQGTLLGAVHLVGAEDVREATGTTRRAVRTSG
ncbi:MAG: hypothetical protein QOJ21_2137 [Solirubrobacteraceae bacterium]|jgi:hypothetical protein|nr:hypothetical protein [Solirubrobacteraceae bacterium]